MCVCVCACVCARAPAAPIVCKSKKARRKKGKSLKRGVGEGGFLNERRRGGWFGGGRNDKAAACVQNHHSGSGGGRKMQAWGWASHDDGAAAGQQKEGARALAQRAVRRPTKGGRLRRSLNECNLLCSKFQRRLVKRGEVLVSLVNSQVWRTALKMEHCWALSLFLFAASVRSIISSARQKRAGRRRGGWRRRRRRRPSIKSARAYARSHTRAHVGAAAADRQAKKAKKFGQQ